MYMDRTFVPKINKPPTYHMGLQLFTQLVVKKQHVRERMIARILQEIRREREGELINSSEIREVLTMLVELGISSKKVYEKEFE